MEVLAREGRIVLLAETFLRSNRPNTHDALGRKSRGVEVELMHLHVCATWNFYPTSQNPAGCIYGGTHLRLDEGFVSDPDLFVLVEIFGNQSLTWLQLATQLGLASWCIAVGMLGQTWD